MKKNKAPEQKQNRLSLNRETIQVLNDPAFLELARGEGSDTLPTTLTIPTQESTSGTTRLSC